MANTVKPIPEGLHSITPNLICRNAAKAIDFYKTVFGATEKERHEGPGGKVIHAELKIGDSMFFVNDTMGKELSGPAPGDANPMYIHLYVPDADDVFGRAVRAGARADMPIQDMFWGDRYGKITDPFGQQWGIATRKEDVSREELARRQEAFFAKAAGGS
jgi:uncharacterized glyoxalase superfamily protein PhnB